MARGLPATIRPVLARLTRRPFDSPGHIFELKWDGMRALAFLEGGSLRLQGRDLTDLTDRFPELRALPRAVAADRTVLDGELVCLDAYGRPSYSLLRERLQGKDADLRVLYVAFDALFVGGRTLLERPLIERKRQLAGVLKDNDIAQVSEFIEGDGKVFFDATCEHGLEGIMAKDKASPYLPGERSPNWQKIKRLRECAFVVCGYDFDGGRRPFVSLILGLYDRGRLRYAGRVSAGFSDEDAREVHSILQGLVSGECPFETPPPLDRLAYWCRPDLACRVSYGEFTPDGNLRYPVYLGLREDKPAADCRIEDAPFWPGALG